MHLHVHRHVHPRMYPRMHPHMQGRLDRKIEIPLPGETARVEVLKIHALTITKKGEIDYE